MNKRNLKKAAQEPTIQNTCDFELELYIQMSMIQGMTQISVIPKGHGRTGVYGFTIVSYEGETWPIELKTIIAFNCFFFIIIIIVSAILYVDDQGASSSRSQRARRAPY